MIEWNSNEASRARAAAELVQRGGAEIESLVRGGSMGSTLPDGACIRIERGETGRYRSGMIVAFLAGDALIAHRVMRNVTDLKGRSGLVTMGDAALLCDPPIPAEIVIGEVRSVRLDGRWAPPGAPPRRAWAFARFWSVTLAGVATCARVDLDITSRVLEALISAGKGPASRTRRLPGGGLLQ